MNNLKKNISPEMIDFYMQKGQQERSDSIFKAINSLKTKISSYIIILRSQKNRCSIEKDSDKACEFKVSDFSSNVN